MDKEDARYQTLAQLSFSLMLRGQCTSVPGRIRVGANFRHFLGTAELFKLQDHITLFELAVDPLVLWGEQRLNMLAKFNGN